MRLVSPNNELHQCKKCLKFVRELEKEDRPLSKDPRDGIEQVCPHCGNNEFHTEEPFPKERLKQWIDLPDKLKAAVILSHAVKLKTGDQKITMAKIFSAVRPQIILGPGYARVSRKSTPALQLAMREYLR